MEHLTVEELRKWFDKASTMQLLCLRAELDQLQDTEDERENKHVVIPVTVGLLSQMLYQSEIKAQRRKLDA